VPEASGRRSGRNVIRGLKLRFQDVNKAWGAHADGVLIVPNSVTDALSVFGSEDRQLSLSF
jgi:hypothetical protein